LRIGPDDFAIAADAAVTRQYELKFARDVGRGARNGKTRTGFRHIPNDTADGFTKRRKRNQGSATHWASPGFPLILPPQKHVAHREQSKGQASLAPIRAVRPKQISNANVRLPTKRRGAGVSAGALMEELIDDRRDEKRASVVAYEMIKSAQQEQDRDRRAQHHDAGS
jgi:hypothetical protein